MKAFAVRAGKRLLSFAIYGSIAIFLALIVAAVLVLNAKPDLSIWHTAHLDEEFTVESDVRTFAEYLALEERLFQQLENEVRSKLEPSERTALNRYYAPSRAAPERWERDWNRTFELAVEEPKAGFLLLHGMSDSPYSLRGIGQRLHEAGGHVVGMRMPGHGTAPSGLVYARWEDMAAAVRIGVRHLHATVGGKPIYLVGYSNGGALSVHYALSTIEEPELPKVAGVVLFSPMIGVTPAAAFAIWQARIGRWLGLDKLSWNGVGPEIDPFKYTSFAVNAGDQTYKLTAELDRMTAKMRDEGTLGSMPPVLALSSAVDATVTVTSLIDVMMARLPAGGHELVLIDVNRVAEVEHILKHDPKDELGRHLRDAGHEFALTVLTNRDERTLAVVEHRRAPRSPEFVTTDLQMEWPPDLFSVGHIAMPFAPEDSLYGGRAPTAEGRVQIGNAALRGERGVLLISPGDMLRIRWNPFYSYVERRILEFTKLDGE